MLAENQNDAGLRASGAAEVAAVLSDHLSAVLGKELPPAVVEKTKHHVLDTLAAMISGSRLKPGRLAIGYAAAQGGRPACTLVGTRILTDPVNAALANGIMAHADETDDSHLPGRYHPGCAVVPAALAVAESRGMSGAHLIKAVAAGYDLGARFSLALGYASPEAGSHSSHCLGANFGAAAAAIALCRFGPQEVRSALSYAIQQASGIRFWQRDEEHVEKAFDFGGMGARNGVTAAALVAAGFTGVQDPFTGPHNFFSAFADEARPGALVTELGARHGVMEASIKKWCVGSPVQAVLDSVAALLAAHDFHPDAIERVVLELPDDRAALVSDRSMPDICAQHLAAVALLDRGLGFAMAHDYGRMRDPAVLALRSRIELRPSAELTRAKPGRQAIVTLELSDGRVLSHRTYAVHGTPDNPMGRADVAAKCIDLAGPVVGAAAARQLAAAAWELDTCADVRSLRPLLQADPVTESTSRR
ncbi:MmgE/PrpD family protein [Propylenella binzhouense]|uniref:MmgE/PrpD family protein n=1 Tax=Propylenella binzhouense TaxID=2555902 RepID=A0A964T575_9HYPH|nr:MmgE/PrpD family protein [Propylenella binzhouense]MYZ48630.1 MmgE/PrpD family protein [Propylenella binzhouense]